MKEPIKQVLLQLIQMLKQQTQHFINKNLLEAWATIEERWGSSFDVDNFTIQLKQNIGQDRGVINMVKICKE